MTAERKKRMSRLKAWLAGDMLISPFVARQVGLIALVAGLVIVYVGNRYAFQLEQVKIKKLRLQLEDTKYEALARSSELMEKSRESNIQGYIMEQGSGLQTSTKPPVVIKK